MLTFKVTYSRQGQVYSQLVEADTYKIESSKHATLFRGDVAVASFIDIDNVVAVGSARVLNNAVKDDLDKIMESNPETPFIPEPHDDYFHMGGF